jgi:hypothetical protein
MKQKLKGGDEYDCCSRWCRIRRSAFKNRWSLVKRKMNKRFRKQGKHNLNSSLDNYDELTEDYSVSEVEEDHMKASGKIGW